jgi:hypothetical protein
MAEQKVPDHTDSRAPKPATGQAGSQSDKTDVARERRIAKVNSLIAESLAMEVADAREAGALGYMARALVQATMPHSEPVGTTFMRQNGAFSMALLGHPKVGLPYGSVPRLLVAFLTSEAVRSKQREIPLGASLSEYMAHLKEVPTGGRWGSIKRVRDQTHRLFACNIACTYTAGDNAGSILDAGLNLAVADTYALWWQPQAPEQLTLFGSYIRLGERFFEEVTQNPVPIDFRVLKALKKSPMALDIYCWLTYRMSYLSRQTLIPWHGLEAQFGADYNQTRQFRSAFIRHLRSVLLLYPEANVAPEAAGLVLRPSATHVARMSLPR